jgi:hypothetical protein
LVSFSETAGKSTGVPGWNVVYYCTFL